MIGQKTLILLLAFVILYLLLVAVYALIDL
jgi:hypothetical protein